MATPLLATIAAFVFVAFAASVEVAANPSRWRRAYVIDAGLATLRASPGLNTRLLKRLRHGRMVAIVERERPADGVMWVRVAVTRRTRGWLPLEAIAWPGSADCEARVAARLKATTGFARLEIARLAIDRFPRLRVEAESAFDDEAERAAEALTRRVARRFPGAGGEPGELRVRMLLDPLLDRYVRLGVRFDADPSSMSYRAVRLR